ncbi:MAG TPA: prenyltransferase [Desulfobacteria bacterium]|nr:prenyltransferase [Desulfobacteria bacterium]
MSREEKVSAWLRLARLQFQPMYVINYSVGAAAAYTTHQVFNVSVYVLGLILISLGVICAAVTNDYYDYPSDRLNTKRGVFNAGSGVLVEGTLGFNEVKVGIIVILGLILVFGVLLIQVAKDVFTSLILVFGLLGIFLLLGYSAPPLKFSYRGLGEIAMSVMTGPYPVLLGYLIQTGRWTDPLPWLMSIPLFLATLTAGAIGSLPDSHADMQISRKRFAVIFGPQLTAIMSLCLIALTALSGVLLWYFRILTGPGSISIFVIIPYSLILSKGVLKLLQTGDYERNIEGIFQLAIFNIMLFGAIPLVSLLWR